MQLNQRIIRLVKKMPWCGLLWVHSLCLKPRTEPCMVYLWFNSRLLTLLPTPFSLILHHSHMRLCSENALIECDILPLSGPLPSTYRLNFPLVSVSVSFFLEASQCSFVLRWRQVCKCELLVSYFFTLPFLTLLINFLINYAHNNESLQYVLHDSVSKRNVCI